MTSDQETRILVVGDWMIDDYWAIGVHRSLTASRIGRHHFRALNPPNSIVQSFAGAGRVASLLSHAEIGDRVPPRVIGIGLWHRNDTAYLKAMFHRRTLRGWTPSQVARTIETAGAPPTSPPALINLADLLDLLDGQHGTTRVVRTNQQTGSVLEVIARIDWETPPEHFENGHRVWVNEENARQFREAADAVIGQLPGDGVEVIVVKDQVKGVVSDATVQWLAAKYPEASWFVSTKTFAPKWLRHIPKGKLQLYLIPEISAQQAVHNNAVYSWFVTSRRLKSAQPTFEALKALDALRSGILADHHDVRLIALPGGYSLLGCHFKRKSPDGLDGDTEALCQPVVEPVPFNRNAAMASAFFPALIANLLHNPGQSLRELVTESLQFTFRFNNAESRWFKNQTLDDSSAPTITRLTVPRKPSETGPEFPATLIVPCDWERDLRKWNLAMVRTGVIEEGESSLRIELWRSMTEIDGYVACVQSKRLRLARLVQELRTFAQGTRTSNCSGILIAKPGSGKTGLVRALAKSLEMRMLDFNITQLNSRADLFACFDEVLTAQAQEQGTGMLVFFDEINALLENQHVYDAFLSPLDSGVYSRSGRKYALRPCVWLFAGTAMPTENEGAPYDKGRKASDFESRLTMQNIDLTEAAELGERTENVYRAVLMLQSCWPDVTHVSQGVVEFFFQLSDIVPRELYRMIERFEGIQYGRVGLSNIPAEVLKVRLRSTLGIMQTVEEVKDGKWIEIK